MKVTVVVLLLIGAAVVSAVSVNRVLRQSFTVGVVTDTYGSFNASLKLAGLKSFEESLRGTAKLLRDGETSETLVRVEIDLATPAASAGTLNLFFESSADAADDAAATAAPNISFSFDLQSVAADDSSSLLASGSYTTNRISYGVYWWRFSTENEFVLQLVDHVFSNTTTIYGWATPMLESRKPWYQNWGLVFVTLGVFIIKMWLGTMQARRAHKHAAMAVAAEKKKKQ